jgi:hypothetical protein
MPNHDTYNDIKSCEKVSDIPTCTCEDIGWLLEPDHATPLQIEYAVDPIRNLITIRLWASIKFV